MSRSRVAAAAVGVAVVLSSSVAGIALAASDHAPAPKKPATGKWKENDGQYLSGITFKVGKTKSGGQVIEHFAGRLNADSASVCSLYVPDATGKFTISGKLPVKKTKAGRGQDFYAFGKRFHDDSEVPAPVTLHFKKASLKGKLAIEFATHRKVSDGQYDFSDGGYLFLTSDSQCGSVFGMKHK